MDKLLSLFFIEEDGASLIEYGLLVSLIAVVVVVALELFGFGVFNMMASSSDSVVEAIETATGGN